MGNIYTFLTPSEFESLCSTRLGEIRRNIATIEDSISFETKTYIQLANDLQELLLKLSRVKVDLENVSNLNSNGLNTESN